MGEGNRLSPEAVIVLQLISAGWSYAQIIDMHPELSYFDIFGAAQEALDMNRTRSPHDDRLAKIKEENPRAYEAWTADEDASVREMVSAGVSQDEIAARLQRQPSATASRIRRFMLAEGNA